MKTFYGGKFLEKSKLEEEGIYHPIKLEYYKRVDKEEKQKGRQKFGISIVKTEYIPDNIKIETKDVKNLSDDENKVEKLLSIFKEFEVTPITAEDVIADSGPQYFNPINQNLYTRNNQFTNLYKQNIWKKQKFSKK